MISTFGAEFASLKRGPEETVMCQYYYQLFGIHIAKPAFIYKDNMPVSLSHSNPGSALQHKSIALSYHYARKHISGEVAEIQKVRNSQNIVDTLAKGLDSSGFRTCIMLIMHI